MFTPAFLPVSQHFESTRYGVVMLLREMGKVGGWVSGRAETALTRAEGGKKFAEFSSRSSNLTDAIVEPNLKK